MIWTRLTAAIAALGMAVAGCAVGAGAHRAARRSGYAAAAVPAGPTGAAAAADANLPSRPQLGDYLAAALADSPPLRSAFHRYRSSVEAVVPAGALPDPRLTYAYYIREVETRVGPQRQSFMLAQTIPGLGKLHHRSTAAEAEARAAWHRFEAARLGLIYRVTDAFLEYHFLARSTEITDENLRLLRALERVLLARYRAAAAERPDLIRLQVEIGKLEDRLRSQRALRGPLSRALAEAANLPERSGPLPWPTAPPRRPAAFTDADLAARLARTSPELKALLAEVDAAEQRIRLARAEAMPDVTVGVKVIDTRDRIGPASPHDDGRDPVIVSAGMNLPIWREKIAAGVRAARHRRRAASSRRAERLNDLQAEVKLTAYRFRDAERKAELYDRVLAPKAREALRVAQAAFQAGKVGFADLIDAQRVLLEFQLARERAEVDRARELARLEMLVGGAVGQPPAEGPPATRPTTRPATPATTRPARP